jgi:hypothetical protein
MKEQRVLASIRRTEAMGGEVVVSRAMATLPQPAHA